MVEYGNFADGKTIEYEDNFKRTVQETCIYKAQDRTIYTAFDTRFLYGMLVTCERRADGSELRYLSGNGELYLDVYKRQI